MSRQRITSSKEIGDRIKKRRRDLKISQEELAERLEVSYQQVQRYENGTSRLNVENIQLIADALSVSLAYFFETYKQPAVAEEKASYLSAEETALLRYFRKIKKPTSKSTVIQVARLAAFHR